MAQTDLVNLSKGIANGDVISIARALTLVENNIGPAKHLLSTLFFKRKTLVLGITGPPGAGKSTLVNALVGELTKREKKIAVLAIDPTSPFNFGSLLGDRVRMGKHFNNQNVFIRSVATRGALGGLSAKTIEMTDVLRAANFDVIFVETVGVGQSEVEIAGLADKTVVVLVPEAGDDIQHMKSGLMEIANAFVVNKADREGADAFTNNLAKNLKQQLQQQPVFKTIAERSEGITKLCDWLLLNNAPANKKELLLLEHAYRLIQQKRMANVNKTNLQNALNQARQNANFNIYRFVENWD